MIKFVKFIINIVVCHFLYRVRYVNKEAEENLDKCLICPNHSNTLEPLWIYAKTDNLWIMAKAELFKYKFFGYLFRKCHVFPIRRGEKDVKSVMHAINIFSEGEKRKLLIFPEGKRIKKDKEKGIAKVGAAYIAYKANVPIIPVYLTKNARLFSKVYVIYGKPVYVTKEIAEDKAKLNEFAKSMLDEAYKLKGDYEKKNNVKIK
ncbi:MAG: lysophospholipid acyltransferase family protein [Clostridia bacterium]|nr:lysophospholipid acyltransferase family protein [Clostridia bacterium]